MIAVAWINYFVAGGIMTRAVHLQGDPGQTLCGIHYNTIYWQFEIEEDDDAYTCLRCYRIKQRETKAA